jgi:hypothetical protein
MSGLKQKSVTATVWLPLTPTHIKSKSKTIQEWLTSICHGKTPNTMISEFDVDLSLRQPSNEYIVCIYGVNPNLDEKRQAHTHIDFKPSNMYFKYPKKKYKDFTYKQMQDELTAQVKDFTMTEQFRNSFLSKSNIRLGFSGEPIWLKE